MLSATSATPGRRLGARDGCGRRRGSACARALRAVAPIARRPRRRPAGRGVNRPASTFLPAPPGAVHEGRPYELVAGRGYRPTTSRFYPRRPLAITIADGVGLMVDDGEPAARPAAADDPGSAACCVGPPVGSSGQQFRDCGRATLSFSIICLPCTPGGINSSSTLGRMPSSRAGRPRISQPLAAGNTLPARIPVHGPSGAARRGRLHGFFRRRTTVSRWRPLCPSGRCAFSIVHSDFDTGVPTSLGGRELTLTHFSEKGAGVTNLAGKDEKSPDPLSRAISKLGTEARGNGLLREHERHLLRDLLQVPLA